MAHKKIFIVEDVGYTEVPTEIPEDYPVERVICFFEHQIKGRGWTGRCSAQYITDGPGVRGRLKIIKQLPFVDLHLGESIPQKHFPRLDNIPEVAASYMASALRGFALDGMFYIPSANLAYPIIEGLSWTSKEYGK